MIQSGRCDARALNEDDIATLRAWEHRLKPYLLKAVALDDRSRFDGIYYSEDLMIYHGVGQHPLSMMRMPVVAFLPRKPHRVYNDVGLMRSANRCWVAGILRQFCRLGHRLFQQGRQHHPPTAW